MADKLRIAVLGMAHDHLWGNLKSLAAQEDAELVAGADYNPVLQKQFTEKTGCGKIYENCSTKRAPMQYTASAPRRSTPNWWNYAPNAACT